MIASRYKRSSKKMLCPRLIFSSFIGLSSGTGASGGMTSKRGFISTVQSSSWLQLDRRKKEPRVRVRIPSNSDCERFTLAINGLLQINFLIYSRFSLPPPGDKLSSQQAAVSLK